jgi:hypothetical protein
MIYCGFCIARGGLDCVGVKSKRAQSVLKFSHREAVDRLAVQDGCGIRMIAQRVAERPARKM